jgi:imidazolonepropionase
MRKPILIRGARQLLTLKGPSVPRRGVELSDLGIIQDGAVLIADGEIKNVGPARQIENLAAARGAEEIDANGRVVLPGFIDSHTHLISGPPRLLDFEMGLAGKTEHEIAEAGGGFPAAFKALQDIPRRTLAAQALDILKYCVRQGTTTIETKSGWGVTEAGELKILRAHASIRAAPVSVVSTFVAARFLPPECGMGQAEYIEWACSHMLPLVARRKLAEFADFSEESEFSLDQARHFLETAKRLGFGLKIQAAQRRNPGAIRLAAELGAASVDHAVQVDEEDAALLARSSVVATLLPGPALYVDTQRYAPARMLIDRGVAVALATNYNPQTCPSHNMQMMMFLACRKMRMTPAEAVSAATINAAHALGRANAIGSIEAGKRADLVMLSVPDYREIPYHFGVNLVEMTMKDGRVIFRAPEMRWLAV